MIIANLAEALEQGAVDSPVDWDPRPDQERFWKYLVNGGKMTGEVVHRVFCIKYGSIWVTDFKGHGRPRTMFTQWAYETWRQRA